ncbi:hypothetical protein AKJ16_DCAP25518 [Drosera capensis]
MRGGFMLSNKRYLLFPSLAMVLRLQERIMVPIQPLHQSNVQMVEVLRLLCLVWMLVGRTGLRLDEGTGKQRRETRNYDNYCCYELLLNEYFMDGLVEVLVVRFMSNEFQHLHHLFPDNPELVIERCSDLCLGNDQVRNFG